MRSTSKAAMIALILGLAGCAGSTIMQRNLGATRQTTAGPALVDSKGMTLYTYDLDEPGQSACTGACAVLWPPATVPAGASGGPGFTTIRRDDGERQWVYKGNPLYAYVGDTKPGQATGDGADGVWHIAEP
jgi:predicted lipoprotein with Yx(FWY)xxD motif